LIDPPGGYNVIKKSFGHLRRFALAHMRAANYQPHEVNERQEEFQAARLELLAYAKMAETVGVGVHTCV